MHYEEPLFRPPSEAGSLILQVTIGCSNNTCTFCPMYKTKRYRRKPLVEVQEEIKQAARSYSGVKRIFLADGDALVLPTADLLIILADLYRYFPTLERVGIYATPQNFLEKELDELKQLAQAGLQIVYFGIESGADSVLKAVKKGVTAAEMITAGQKAMQSGFILSTTVVLGLGGKEESQHHARETARVVSAINPHYLGALTLMLNKHAPLQKKIDRGEFTLLNSREILEELGVLISCLETTQCIFRSNHASNYLPLKGVLNKDKDALLLLIKKACQEPSSLREEFRRGL